MVDQRIIPNNEGDLHESGRRNRAALRYIHNCARLKIEPNKHEIEVILLGRNENKENNCEECNGAGIVGYAPDGYFPCPSCGEQTHPDDRNDDRESDI